MFSQRLVFCCVSVTLKEMLEQSKKNCKVKDLEDKEVKEIKSSEMVKTVMVA